MAHLILRFPIQAVVLSSMPGDCEPYSNYSHLEDQLFSNFFWLFEKKFQQKTVFIEWLTRPIKLKKVELVLKESMSTYRYKNCLDYLITMSLEL